VHIIIIYKNNLIIFNQNNFPSLFAVTSVMRCSLAQRWNNLSLTWDPPTEIHNNLTNQFQMDKIKSCSPWSCPTFEFLFEKLFQLVYASEQKGMTFYFTILTFFLTNQKKSELQEIKSKTQI